MAVAFDAVGPSSAGTSVSGATSLSWTHTGVGSALAYIAGGGCAADAATTTLTVDGASATSLGKVHNGGGTAGFTEAFGIANVATGARSVVWTASTSTDLEGGSASYTGAGTTFGTAFGTPVTHASAGNVSSDTVTVTGTTAGNIVSGLGSAGSSISSFTGQRWLINFNALSGAGNAAGGDAAGGGSVSLTLTETAADFIGLVAVEILAGTAASVSIPQAQPGAAWRRQFKHRQTLPAASVVGPQNYQQALNATLSFTSSANSATSTTRSASVGFTSSMTLRTAKNVAIASLSFTGSLATAVVHFFTQSLNATLSFSSSQIRSVGKRLSGSLSFTSSQTRQISKTISAGLSFASSQTRRISTNLASAVSFTSSQTRRTVKSLGSATLSFTGSLTTQAVHFFTQALNASLSFTGSLTTHRTVFKTLTASLSFTTSMTRQTGKALIAGLAFTGTQTKRIAKTISAAVGLTGLLQRLSSAIATSGTASAAQMKTPESTPATGSAPTSGAGAAQGPTSTSP